MTVIMFLVYKLACRVDNSPFFIIIVSSLIWVQLSCLHLLFMYYMNYVSTFLSYLTKPRCSTSVLPQQKLIVTDASKAAIKKKYIYKLYCKPYWTTLAGDLFGAACLVSGAFSMGTTRRDADLFITSLCSYYIAPLCVSSLRSKTWLIPTLFRFWWGTTKGLFFLERN